MSVNNDLTPKTDPEPPPTTTEPPPTTEPPTTSEPPLTSEPIIIPVGEHICDENHKCGYYKYKQLGRIGDESRTLLVNDIIVRTTVGTPATAVTSVNVNNFFSGGVNLISHYAGTPVRTYVTNDGTRTWAISNMVFDQLDGDPFTVQFVAIDGSGLTQPEYSDPYYVITQYNLGNLPIVNYTGPADSSNPTTVANRQTFDGYTGGLWAAKMLHEYFGRTAIFNRSAVFLMVMNVPEENAFWNGHYLTFGIFQSPPLNSFTSIDIVAHEMGHGVIDSSGSNEYYGESGSINEANCDVFGIQMRHYLKTHTPALSITPFDWTVGGQLFTPPLRVFSNPALGSPPVGTYKFDSFWYPPNAGPDGGIYDNIGIVNHFWYLLVAGSGGNQTNHLGDVYNIGSPFVDIIDMFRIMYHCYPGTRLSDEYKWLPFSGDINEIVSTIKFNLPFFARDLGVAFDVSNNINEIADAQLITIIEYVAFNPSDFNSGTPYYTVPSYAPEHNQYYPLKGRNIFDYVTPIPKWYTYIPRRLPKFIPLT